MANTHKVNRAYCKRKLAVPRWLKLDPIPRESDFIVSSKDTSYRADKTTNDFIGNLIKVLGTK